jgi:putative hydrolase
MNSKSRLAISCDVHAHTVHSGHAFSTVNELATAAAEASLELIAITDHGPSMEGAPHAGYFEMAGRLPSEILGVRILMGVEANIVSFDGELDLPAELLRKQHIVLAGLHERTALKRGTKADHTRAIRRAMECGCVHVITHPYRPGFEVEVKELARVAAQTGVSLEINVSLIRWATSPGGDPAKSEVMHHHRHLVEEMERAGARCTIASDAHHSSEITAFVRSADDAIAALQVPPEMIVNRRVDDLLDYLKVFR